MRLLTLESFCIALFFLPVAAHSAEASKETNAASEARLQASVKYLASDELQGRGVGTDGLNVAADHIAQEFAKLGLKTTWFDGTPFQKFTVAGNTEMGDKKHNRLVLRHAGEGDDKSANEFALQLEQNFTPLAIGGSGEFDAEMVFVGYSISAQDLKYDDYAGVEVKDKVVVMLRKEPQQDDADSPFDGKKASRYATFQRKVGAAASQGAAAVIIVNDNFDVQNKSLAERKRWTQTLDKLTDKQNKFKEIDSPTDQQFTAHLKEVAELTKQLQSSSEKLQQQQFDQLVKFQQAGIGNRTSMPVFFVARAAMDKVIQAALNTSLAELERQIDDDLKPRSAVLKGWQAVGEAKVIKKQAEIKNVVGVLEGEGPLADETVIIGAHYDHLGMGGAGTFAPWTVEIHNGADDNASGTAALLEVAHRLATRAEKPRRRVVFIAFSGEERGLLGSAHYVKNPRFPLEDTVAMLNMDMVGRMNDNKLIVYGTGTAKGFDDRVERLNQTYDFKLTKHATGMGPSDHASFYPKKIPVIHVFTGTHKDYHRPSDDWEKINVTDMRRVVDFVVDFADEVIADDERPEYVEVKRRATPEREGERPYLGTIPDFAVDAEGYALQDVVPDGPAAKAGLKAGDVITKFADDKITSLDDIDKALRKFKAGNKVKVTVQRNGKDVTVEVTLDPPR